MTAAMALLKALLTLLLLLALQTDGQLESPGKCPKHNGITNFNTTSYMGTWYGYKKYNSTEDLNCFKVRYFQPETGEFQFMTKGRTKDNRAVEFKGMIYRKCVSRLCYAKFRIWRDVDRKSYTKLPGFKVLYTDYIRVSIIYFCDITYNNGQEWHQHFLVILVRSKVVTRDLKTEIKKKVRKMNLPWEDLKTIRGPGPCTTSPKGKKKE